MILDLFDFKKKKTVKLILKNENVIPANDLYVVFITKDATCSLYNGTDSSPFNEYLFKKINHIITAVTEYENEEYSLTIGYILSNNNLVPFLIDHRGCETDNYTFENVSHYEETNCTEFKIFNYREYVEFLELGIEKLSFKEFIDKLIKGGIDHYCYKLYSVAQIDSNRLLKNNEFTAFLDEEENKAH